MSAKRKRTSSSSYCVKDDTFDKELAPIPTKKIKVKYHYIPGEKRSHKDDEKNRRKLIALEFEKLKNFIHKGKQCKPRKEILGQIKELIWEIKRNDLIVDLSNRGLLEARQKEIERQVIMKRDKKTRLEAIIKDNEFHLEHGNSSSEPDQYEIDVTENMTTAATCQFIEEDEAPLTSPSHQEYAEEQDHYTEEQDHYTEEQDHYADSSPDDVYSQEIYYQLITDEYNKYQLSQEELATYMQQENKDAVMPEGDVDDEADVVIPQSTLHDAEAIVGDAMTVDQIDNSQDSVPDADVSKEPDLHTSLNNIDQLNEPAELGEYNTRLHPHYTHPTTSLYNTPLFSALDKLRNYPEPMTFPKYPSDSVPSVRLAHTLPANMFSQGTVEPPYNMSIPLHMSTREADLMNPCHYYNGAFKGGRGSDEDDAHALNDIIAHVVTEEVLDSGPNVDVEN